MNLTDIPLARYKLHEPEKGDLDDEIIPLIVSLNFFGVNTVGSCSGGIDSRRHPFPWVSVYPAGTTFETVKQELERLKGVDTSKISNPGGRAWTVQKTSIYERMFALYEASDQYQGPFNWTFERSWLRPTVEATGDSDLVLLREDAINLADYLFTTALEQGSRGDMGWWEDLQPLGQS